MGGKEKKSVICRNCGAEFSAAEPNCPYCGAMYIPAAEAAYMRKLGELHRDLNELGDLPAREAKKSFGRLMKRLVPALVALAVLAAAFAGYGVIRERREAQKAKEDYLWQRENFPIMDKYYETGDYDALAMAFYEAVLGDHSVFQYKRAAFCEGLVDIFLAREQIEALGPDEQAPGLLCRELSLTRFISGSRMTEEELDILMKLREPILEDLERRFHLTEEEKEPFLEQLRTKGYINYKDCESFISERGD